MEDKGPRPSLRDKIRKTILPDLAEVVMSWIEKPVKRIDWNEITAEFHIDDISPDIPHTSHYRSPFPASNRVHLYFFGPQRFRYPLGLEPWEPDSLWNDIEISRQKVDVLLQIEVLKDNLGEDFKPSTTSIATYD